MGTPNSPYSRPPDPGKQQLAYQLYDGIPGEFRDGMRFVNLPLEIIYEIGWSVPYQRDVLALAQTCRMFGMAFSEHSNFFWHKRTKHNKSINPCTSYNENTPYKFRLLTFKPAPDFHGRKPPLCRWCLTLEIPQKPVYKIEWEENRGKLEICKPCLLDNCIRYAPIKFLKDCERYPARCCSIPGVSSRLQRKLYWRVDIDFLVRKYSHRSLYQWLWEKAEEARRKKELELWRQEKFAGMKEGLLQRLTVKAFSSFTIVPSYRAIFSHVQIDSFQEMVSKSIFAEFSLINLKTLAINSKSAQAWEERVAAALHSIEERNQDAAVRAISVSNLFNNKQEFVAPLVDFHMDRLKKDLQGLSDDDAVILMDMGNIPGINYLEDVLGQCIICTKEEKEMNESGYFDDPNVPRQFYSLRSLPWHYYVHHKDNLLNDQFIFSPYHKLNTRCPHEQSAFCTMDHSCGQNWEEPCIGIECDACKYRHQCRPSHYEGTDMSEIFFNFPTAQAFRDDQIVKDFALLGATAATATLKTPLTMAYPRTVNQILARKQNLELQLEVMTPAERLSRQYRDRLLVDCATYTSPPETPVIPQAYWDRYVDSTTTASGDNAFPFPILSLGDTSVAVPRESEADGGSAGLYLLGPASTEGNDLDAWPQTMFDYSRCAFEPLEISTVNPSALSNVDGVSVKLEGGHGMDSYDCVNEWDQCSLYSYPADNLMDGAGHFCFPDIPCPTSFNHNTLNLTSLSSPTNTDPADMPLSNLSDEPDLAILSAILESSSTCHGATVVAGFEVVDDSDEDSGTDLNSPIQPTKSQNAFQASPSANHNLQVIGNRESAVNPL